MTRVVASIVLVAVINVIGTAAWASAPKLPARIMAEWRKVAVCETGADWTMEGPVYSGALGIQNVNWVAYGGLQFAPTAGQATPVEQVIVARRINRGFPVPDQHGCSGKW